MTPTIAMLRASVTQARTLDASEVVGRSTPAEREEIDALAVELAAWCTHISTEIRGAD